MAFPYIGGQIPQPNNPVQTAAQSFNLTQKAIADNLLLQQQKEYSKAYPQLLQQQLDLAGLKLAEQEVATQYAPQTAEANYQKLLADTESTRANIPYTQAIGRAAESNAQTAAIQAQIAQESLPAMLAQIGHQNKLMQFKYDVMQNEFDNYTNGGQSASGIIPPLPQNMIIDESGKQVVQAKGDTPAHEWGTLPEDFLPANAGRREGPDFIEKEIIEPMRSQEQQAEAVGAATQRGRQNEINFGKYTEKVTADASLASTENVMLDQMNDRYKQIPFWNKGLVTKFLEDFMGPLAQESKVYTTLKNGLIFENLGNLKGAASDLDVQKIEAMFPGLTFTDESAEEAIVLRQLINDRKMEKLAYIARNPNLNEKELEVGWNGFQNANSIFDSERWQALQDPEGLFEE